MTDPHTLPPLSFAPLEGITGWIFRQVHHAMFPGLSRYYTPFFAPTADSPLTGRGLRDMHPDHNRGVPVVPQLLTNRAEDFIASARLLQDLGYKEVNLNLGCPSGTVVAKKKGAGFLSQPQALARFLDQIFQTLDVNISIKTRIGVENLEEWPPLLDLFQRYPICELIIHPRLRRDFYRGQPRREAFTYAVAHSRCATTGTCSLPRTVGTWSASSQRLDVSWQAAVWSATPLWVASCRAGRPSPRQSCRRSMTVCWTGINPSSPGTGLYWAR